MNLANGLLGLGGFNGIGGTQPQLTGLLGQYYNPQDLKKAKLKAGLLNAGIALLSQKPELGQGIGTSLGAALRGGSEGAQQAQVDYMQNALMGYQMDRQAQDDAWQAKTRERQQHAWDSEDQANEARKAFYAALPEDQRQLAEAYPEQFGKLYAEAQLGKVFPQGKNYEIIQDKSTGEIVAIDRANPSAGPVVVRNGGLPTKEAPKTQVINQPDGSQVAVQWDERAGKWIPLQAPEGGNAVKTLPKLTEGQSKDLVYYQRGKQAQENLEGVGTALTGYGDTIKGNVPFVGNSLVSKDYQLANQAGREFLAAILRKDTGAAVTKQEFEIYGDMYLPRPGDTPEVLQQKKDARSLALDAIKVGMGAASRALPDQAPAQSPLQSPLPDLSNMSDEELRAILNGQ